MAGSDPPEGLWDSEKLAAFLGIPVKTLDQWSWRRVGPPFLKVGKHRRYDPADVRRWLDSRRSETT